MLVIKWREKHNKKWSQDNYPDSIFIELCLTNSALHFNLLSVLFVLAFIKYSQKNAIIPIGEGGAAEAEPEDEGTHAKVWEKNKHSQRQQI